jgi:DNA-directed RNA polymerase
MTSVYGVTFIGARSQIEARLRDRGFADDDNTYLMACYAARVRTPRGAVKRGCVPCPLA